MIDQFCAGYRQAPASIALDIDDTFDTAVTTAVTEGSPQTRLQPDILVVRRLVAARKE